MYCESDPDAYVSEQEKFFRGNHLLASVDIIPDNNKATYIPATKEIYLEVDNKVNTAQFMFKNNNGEYMVAILPYNMMRFQFLSEDATEQPYCKFRWNPNASFSTGNWQGGIVYYVIAIKKSQIRSK
jgi:hypothetical protein